MTKRLRDEDRRAIDMLLDRLPSTVENGGNGHTSHVGFATTMGNGFQHRLQSVERLLKNLDEMPAGDPPSDLLARTLKRLEEARPVSAAKLPPGLTSTTHPHA